MKWSVLIQKLTISKAVNIFPPFMHPEASFTAFKTVRYRFYFLSHFIPIHIHISSSILPINRSRIIPLFFFKQIIATVPNLKVPEVYNNNCIKSSSHVHTNRLITIQEGSKHVASMWKRRTPVF